MPHYLTGSTFVGLTQVWPAAQIPFPAPFGWWIEHEPVERGDFAGSADPDDPFASHFLCSEGCAPAAPQPVCPYEWPTNALLTDLTISFNRNDFRHNYFAPSTPFFYITDFDPLPDYVQIYVEGNPMSQFWFPSPMGECGAECECLLSVDPDTGLAPWEVILYTEQGGIGWDDGDSTDYNSGPFRGWFHRSSPLSYPADPTNPDLDTLFTYSEFLTVTMEQPGSFHAAGFSLDMIRLFPYWPKTTPPEGDRRRAMVI